MHTRFLFVRHATCAQIDRMLLGRQIDAPLDACGHDEASSLARALHGLCPQRIESSPRLRARQTADAIACASGLPVQINDDLDELDFGDWAGCSFDALADDPRWNHWNAARNRASTPAGVTIAGTQARLLRLLGDLSRRFPGSAQVIVTHAEIVRSMLLLALGRDANDYVQFDIAPASITMLDFRAGTLELACDQRRRRA